MNTAATSITAPPVTEARIAPLLVVMATSDTVLGVFPEVNPEGQTVFNTSVIPYWETREGKSVRRVTYAAWEQAEQVRLAGTEERLDAVAITCVILEKSRVPKRDWTPVSVSVTHSWLAELSLRQAICLAAG